MKGRRIVCLFLILILFAGRDALGIDQHDPFIELPSNLPPSLYPYIESQPVLDASSGTVRFVVGVQGITKRVFLARADLDQLSTRQFVFFGAQKKSDLGGPNEIFCECDVLSDDEFIISEVPVVRPDGRYVSLNDESYKAILELIRYPFHNIALAAVALSELAYVYNSDALRIFLANKGYESLLDRGFMNSPDYPGYRDSQYLVLRGHGQVFVVVRGTSGPLDVETSVDVELVPFRQLGLAHSGYLDIAQQVYDTILPLLQNYQEPIVVTGHSLGGSVTVMLTLMLLQDGLSVSGITFAPVPPVDFRVMSAFEGLARLTNYFLPNEELRSLEERGNWLYLPGKRDVLPDVGTTAGAAHFVINYLKSMLVVEGLSREDYETDLPDCVVTKYACFDGNKDNFISACAYTDDRCMNREMNFLTGFPVETELDTRKFPLDLFVERTARRLVESETPHQRKVLRYRLVYLFLRQGEYQKAESLLESIGASSKAGFHKFLQDALQRVRPSKSMQSVKGPSEEPF